MQSTKVILNQIVYSRH